jgi:hypothetical protein
LWLLVPALALAGYGDATDGHPSAEERELFVWANAVRVAPEEFLAEYEAGGCDWDDFSAAEQSPTHPLRWNAGLGSAARRHSEDMREHGNFGHVGSDGSTLGDRLSFFPGTVGENVSSGYADPEDATLEGWMCSPSHREILMSDMWDELGTGMADDYFTQDFGESYGPPRAVSMAAHVRESGRTVVFADWWASDGEAPDRYEVVVDGIAWPMGLLWGEPGQGIYATPLDHLGDECHVYFVEAERAGVITRFPESGAYGWGDCGWDDATAEWTASRPDRIRGGDPIEGVPDDPGLGLDEAVADEVEDTLGTSSPRGCGAREPSVLAFLAMVSFAGARPRSRGRPSPPARTRPRRR